MLFWSGLLHTWLLWFLPVSSQFVWKARHNGPSSCFPTIRMGDKGRVSGPWVWADLNLPAAGILRSESADGSYCEELDGLMGS